MKPLEMLLKNAAQSRHKIVLSEGEDPRVIDAAIEAQKMGIAQVILVGNKGTISDGLKAAGASADAVSDIFDPATSVLTDELTELFFNLRKHKGISRDVARKAVNNPHVFAALLVKAGYAAGTVGGAVATTAEIVRTALQVIGPRRGAKIVSSFFMMLLCEEHHDKKGAFIFADSGLVVDPSAEEMAEIAVASAHSFTTLTGEEARVAMLSFSTRGSAKHDAVTKVATATELARAKDPLLLVDGELQFDAAFVPGVANAKAPDSPLGGEANIFIFPNLESGNIAYKIAQRVGGALAIGPILQGLDHPANDLSRGCSAEDIVHMIAVTAAQAD